MGLLLFLVLAIEIVNCILIFNNDYFDIVYAVVYLAILLILVGAASLMIFYFAMEDSPQSRFYVPYSFLLAGLCEILLAIWIIIFIFLVYDKSKVYVSAFEDGDFSSLSPEEENKKKIVKISKNAYVYKHLILPICSSILFLLFYCTA